MSLQWEKSSDREHQKLPRKATQIKDPAWLELMAEIAMGNVVKVRYSDPKDKSVYARSVGRRAAHMGFRVDQRQGEDEQGLFLSVQRVSES